MADKNFPLPVVLSVTTGILLCDIGKVYEILNYMTGDNLFTHQLPRASEECRPWLLRQHPKLAEIDASGVGRDNWSPWLLGMIEKYGAELEVSPVPPDAHEFRHPMEELESMVGRDKIIPVVVP